MERRLVIGQAEMEPKGANQPARRGWPERPVTIQSANRPVLAGDGCVPLQLSRKMLSVARVSGMIMKKRFLGFMLAGLVGGLVVAAEPIWSDTPRPLLK